MSSVVENLQGVLQFKKVDEIFYLTYKNFPISLVETTGIGLTKIDLSLTIEQTSSIGKIKKDIQNVPTVTNVSFGNNLLSISFSINDQENNNFLPNFETVINIFSSYGVKPICSICKQVVSDKFYKINGKINTACNNCLDLSKSNSGGGIPDNPPNYLICSLGALIGALAGSVVWILIGLLGFYASIGGVAIAYASYFGYTKLGGKNSKITVVIIAASVLIAVVFAELFGIGIEVVKYLRGENIPFTIREVISFIFVILADPESSGQYFLNMLLGLLFAGLGSFRLLKNIFMSTNAQKLDIQEV